MSRNTKRKIDELQAAFQSDSDDGDYDNSAPAPSRSKRKSGKNRSIARKPAKRRRDRYGSDDDDIEDDEDDFSEEEASYSDSDDSEDSVRDPNTGRRRRKAAVKGVSYEESSDDASSSSDQSPPPQPRKQEKLIVKLRIAPEKMRNLRARSTRATSNAAQSPDLAGAGTRRSSRISASEEPLMQLSNSGRHVEFKRRPSNQSGDEDVPVRATLGGKSAKKFPSAIMEAEDEEPNSHEQGEDAAQTDDDEDEEMKEEDDHSGADNFVLGSDVKANGKDAEADATGDDDDDDDDPIIRRPSRILRARPPPESPAKGRRSLRNRSKALEQSSDFEPDAEEDEVDDNISDDELGLQKPRAAASDTDDGPGRRSGRLSKRNRGSRRESEQSEAASELDLDEIADEAADLAADRRRNKRPRRGRHVDEISFEPNLRNRSNRPDYRIFRPELASALDDEDNAPAPSASQGRSRKAAAAYRTLFSTLGPFGGAGGPPPVFGHAPGGAAAAGGADSDSSDDDMMRRPSHAMGGAVGMTPTQGQGHFGLVPQNHNADPAQAGSGAPANFGKVKDRKALADADPLGIDPNVSFDGVGGLGDHIDRLKEMVALPLLYPEIFMRMHVTPPRGVLFHGPPGTGKTLLARALASSVSSHGKKVTFYMRKGADALSKWVGEAERQLRLLFEEARKNQPSIIFFDEIDGLAPVRSSKQEQIHASIVATLLALMDGMDGRGQVIVIGATNRPDSVDPALRRPGRFDREFYFPLPNKDARRAIIDIHTKGWEPALQPKFKDQLAELTKGYGGADLRALCTEAALNAVQGTYPQIYSSNTKLLIDPSKIKVLAKDFMISVNKIVPSSERSASSGSAPLKKSIEPLLRKSLAEIEEILKELVPTTKKRTALEEAEYDDRDDEFGFEKENMQREFDGARIFRPRLLISGMQGMGQQYLGAALLNKFEGMYVANFDLSNIYKDSTRSPEAAIVQMFEEVKRHKPSVIFIPNVDVWYSSLQDSAIRTFTGLLRGLAPTDPVLLLGVMEMASPEDKPDRLMLRDLFSYSAKNLYKLDRPDEGARREYFGVLVDYIRRSPAEFPDPENRKKRDIPKLPEAPAPVEVPKAPSKEEIKAQKKHDRHILNTLKLQIQLVMDQIKLKYKKFRVPPIEETRYLYLFDEEDPGILSTDLGADEARQHMHRPYEKHQDKKGEWGLLEVETGRFYYNLEIVSIEKRLSNGYYKRPQDFLSDIKKLRKDAETCQDQDRILKANEMYANVEVDMINIEKTNPAFAAECEALYQRELAKEKELKKAAAAAGKALPPAPGAMAAPAVPAPTDGAANLGITGAEGGVHEEPSGLSNGTNGTNGSHDDDVEMGNTQDGTSTAPAQFSTPDHATQTKSQHSSVMQIAPGSQAKDYYNSVTTTTSGDKSSKRISDQTDSTGLSNGVAHPNTGFDFSMIEPTGGSQLPDTQEQHSGSAVSPRSTPEPHTQVASMGPPALPVGREEPSPRRGSDIGSLLNHEPSSTPQAPAGQPAMAPPAEPASVRQPTLIPADANLLADISRELVRRSSGLSVEQLEQVMAALMRAIWNSRRECNRNIAAKMLVEAFNETVLDLESVQTVLRPSQDDDEYANAGKGFTGSRISEAGRWQ